MAKNLYNFFEKFIGKESLFADKSVLQSQHVPEDIPHRNDQISQVANILAPSLRVERPSNLFIYGKTGTGKTLTVKYTTEQILEVATARNIPIKVFYLNCKLKKVADTEYRLIAQLARFFGKSIPATGLPTDEVYSAFFDALDEKKQVVIIVLDEIDQLVKKVGDEIIYNLTRINSELKQGQVSIIGISNDLMFSNNMDPRVRSSLSEEELIFPPYNAIQLQDILKERAEVAFKDEIIKPGVIQKCAAYAAREHGDARRALELLRVAGEIAERSGVESVEIKHIDEAEDKIERERIYELVTTQPKQFQAVLYTAIKIDNTDDKKFFTGDVYELYRDICKKADLRPLTQRRVSDVLAELDMLGILNAKVISKGRFGRTKEISLAIPSSMISKIEKLIAEELNLK